jgi:hypothetical protein
MNYQSESAALDAQILRVIAEWHERGIALDDDGFNDLALRLWAYQVRYNAPYATYCERLGITLSKPPPSWESIPAVAAPSFRSARIATFDGPPAALFETSGTTTGESGRHYLETTALYDAALLAAFDRFMLADGARLRYLNLVPNPAQSPHSSLGYMMQRVSSLRGDKRCGWYLEDGVLRYDAFVAGLQEAIAENQSVCIAATAFALVHLLATMEERDVYVALPAGSRIMETGGFKGRSKAVSRDALYAQLCERFNITGECIVAEYGMTELSSQYYDDARRRKVGPPWLRSRIVGPERTTLPDGEVGSLIHVDLANRSSCIAVQTADMARRDGNGFYLLGREIDAEPRGCSLTAEALRVSSGS